MAYNTSKNYKDKIYADGVQHELKIYIDDVKVNDSYILGIDFKYELFEKKVVSLGGTPKLEATLKLYKTALPETYNIFYIESGIRNGEIVPVGYFEVDSVNDEDDKTVTVKLKDYMDKFEINYDGSKHIPVTLKQLAQNICNKIGVELGSTSFLNDDVEISVYDNTVKARTYLSYIAEQAGGIAHIGRDGKLYIKTLEITKDENNNVINIPFIKFKEYKFSKQAFKCTRIKFEDGKRNFVFGTEEKNTIYINPNNMFIVSEEQVQKIFNKLNGLELYGFTGTTIIDPAIDVGDIVFVNNKPIIYQGTWQYLGKNKVNIKSEINPEEKSEAMTTKLSNKTILRRVESQIDQAEGKIQTLVAEIGDRTDKNTTITQDIDSIISKVEQTIDTTREVTGTKLTLENCMRGNLLELHIYGNNTVFSDLTLSDDLLLGDNTILFDGSSYILVHSEDLKNKFEKQYAYRYVSYSIDYNHTTLEVTGYNAYSKKTTTNNRCYVMELEAGKTYHIVLDKNEVNDTKWLYLATFSENPWENEEDENITAINYYGNLRTIYNKQENAWKHYTNTEEVHITFTATEMEKYLTFYCYTASTFETALICENYQKIDLGITEPLRQLGSVYDEYVLERNKAKIIKRVGITDTGVLYPLPIEEEIDLGELTINLAKGTNYISILDYVANMMAKYVIINEFTEQFTTTVEFETVIKQLYNSISLIAKEKIGEDEIISKINLAVQNEQGIIEITSNLIEITSDYFQLTKEGIITAIAGTIAGLTMERNAGISKLYKKIDNYESGLWIPDNDSTVPFLYAGFDESKGSSVFNSNAYITHSGEVYAKFFSVNGESGYFYINFNSGRRAMTFSNNGILFKLDDTANNSFSSLIRNADGMFINMYSCPHFIINDALHNLTIASFNRQTDTGYPASINFYRSTYYFGNGNSTGYEIATKNDLCDRNLKKNIITSTKNALDRINQIEFKQFDWDKEKINKEGHIDIGIIAQQVGEIDSNYIDKTTIIKENKTEEYYTINTLNMLTTSMKAIQELDDENKKLKKQVDTQQKTIDFLINKLNFQDELEEYL